MVLSINRFMILLSLYEAVGRASFEFSRRELSHPIFFQQKLFELSFELILNTKKDTGKAKLEHTAILVPVPSLELWSCKSAN